MAPFDPHDPLANMKATFKRLFDREWNAANTVDWAFYQGWKARP